jgi:peptidoglycan/xylan/chitin deacetylase (PgdA/CDA1 family)
MQTDEHAPAGAVLTRLNLVALACGASAAGAAGLFGAGLLSLGIPAAVFAALCIDGIARPGSSLAYPTVTHGPRDRNRVALSFDDGPDPEVTPLVLDALARYDTRATFFTIGRAVAANPGLAKAIVAAGHELGNHSWAHSRYQNFFAVDKQEREIERGVAAIAAVTGRRNAPLYRPPLGMKSPPMARAAWRKKLTLVAWSLHSHDSRVSDPERIATRVLAKIRPGDIVLLHDGHDLPGRHRPATARALPRILAGLREKGLQGVTVSQLLRSSN